MSERDNKSEGLILVAEDNAGDVFLVREALRMRNLDCEVHHVPDGEKAIQFIERLEHDFSVDCPVLLLLDMNLPRKSGDEVLQQVKRSKRCPDIPVIIFSSSESPDDKALAAQFGVTRYFHKPSDFDAFMRLGAVIEDVLRRPS